MKNSIFLILFFMSSVIAISQTGDFKNEIKSNFDDSNFKYFVNNYEQGIKVDEKKLLDFFSNFNGYVKNSNLIFSSNISEILDLNRGEMYDMLYLKWQNEKGEIKFMISFYLNSKRTAPVFYNIEFINYNNEDEMMAFPGGKIDPKKIPPPVPPPPPLPKEKTGKDGVPPPPPPPPPGNY